MKKDETITLVKMEDDLIGDKTGAYKKSLIQRLIDEKTSLTSKLNKGLTPDEYAPINAYRSAIDAAIQIVERYWSSKH